MNGKESKHCDDILDDGVYAIPRKEGEPKIKVRALFKYCEENGKKPEELSDEEVKQFLGK